MRCLALAAALLGACASPPRPAIEPVVVVWNRVDDIQATCSQVSGRKELFRLRGCSTWSESAGSRTCAIYASPPKSEMDTQAFATLGHELMHCFDGHWHDRWGGMNGPERQAAARK